ncbi:MAG: arsenate reductase ArsC [Chloroflexi bacterium]|nr:arsenate reductase ArsC [Chloroflexota bacterium]
MNSVRRKVLFLCTGNSCRSQMAEAIVNACFGDIWEAVSAGTRPVGYVHPKAIQVLTEVGIEHHGESKTPGQFGDTNFDLVVTVCDSAAEDCPVWLGKGSVIHHSFPDPASVTGSEDEILAVFRDVRDEIGVKIPTILLGNKCAGA